jgi:hypothetical protein
MPFTSATELFFYAFTLWLGAYLLARDIHKPAVSLTGWGLLAYSLALAAQIVFDRLILALILIPRCCGSAPPSSSSLKNSEPAIASSASGPSPPSRSPS